MYQVHFGQSNNIEKTLISSNKVMSYYRWWRVIFLLELYDAQQFILIAFKLLSDLIRRYISTYVN